MNVLITGGAGYIGMELSYALAEQREVDQVVILDRLNRNNYNMFCGQRKFKGATLILEENDILNTRALEKIVAPADLIFHLAAQTPTQNFLGSSHIFEQNNHWGTASVVEAIKYTERGKRLINLSTLGVYGTRHISFPEQDTRPHDPYSISKLRAEAQIFELQDFEKHSYVNVRCPIVFGYSKNLRIDQAINRMVFDAKMRRRVQIFGDSPINTPHIYMKDLIENLISIGFSELTDTTIIPAFQTISAHQVFENLQDKIDGLEAIFVDQAAYPSEVQIPEGLNTYNAVQETDSLANQLSEFLTSFIN